MLRRLLQPRLLLLSLLLRPLLQPAVSPSVMQVLRDHALSSAGSGRQQGHQQQGQQQGGEKGGAGRRTGSGNDGVGLYERMQPEGVATSIAVAVRAQRAPAARGGARRRAVRPEAYHRAHHLTHRARVQRRWRW